MRMNRGALALLVVLGALFALSFPATKLALDLSASVSGSQLTLDGVDLVIALGLAVIACFTVIGGHYAGLSFALYLFALSRAAGMRGHPTIRVRLRGHLRRHCGRIRAASGGRL